MSHTLPEGYQIRWLGKNAIHVWTQGDVFKFFGTTVYQISDSPIWIQVPSKKLLVSNYMNFPQFARSSSLITQPKFVPILDAFCSMRGDPFDPYTPQLLGDPNGGCCSSWHGRAAFGGAPVRNRSNYRAEIKPTNMGGRNIESGQVRLNIWPG